MSKEAQRDKLTEEIKVVESKKENFRKLALEKKKAGD